MLSFETETEVGNLGVITKDHRGHSVEEIANMATDKIISISKTCLLYTSPSPRD